MSTKFAAGLAALILLVIVSATRQTFAKAMGDLAMMLFAANAAIPVDNLMNAFRRADIKKTYVRALLHALRCVEVKQLSSSQRQR